MKRSQQTAIRVLIIALQLTVRVLVCGDAACRDLPRRHNGTVLSADVPECGSIQLLAANQCRARLPESCMLGFSGGSSETA